MDLEGGGPRPLQPTIPACAHSLLTSMQTLFAVTLLSFAAAAGAQGDDHKCCGILSFPTDDCDLYCDRPCTDDSSQAQDCGVDDDVTGLSNVVTYAIIAGGAVFVLCTGWVCYRRCFYMNQYAKRTDAMAAGAVRGNGNNYAAIPVYEQPPAPANA